MDDSLSNNKLIFLVIRLKVLFFSELNKKMMRNFKMFYSPRALRLQQALCHATGMNIPMEKKNQVSPEFIM